MSRLPVLIYNDLTEIRAIQFRSGFGNQSFSEPVSRRITEDAVTDTLNLITEHFSDTSGVYLHPPVEAVFQREIELPFIEKKKIRDVLPFELESLLPYEPDEMVYDHYRYPDLEKRTTRVLINGTLSRSMRPYLEAFKENSIPVAGIYSQLDALFHLFSYTAYESGILLYLSRFTGYLIIVIENQWYSSRVITGGYNSLLHDLSEKMKISYEEAEDLVIKLPGTESEIDDAFLKDQFKLSGPKIKKLHTALSDFAGGLSDEIRLTLQSNRSLPAELPVIAAGDINSRILPGRILAENSESEVSVFPYESTPVSLFDRRYLMNIGGVLSQTGSSKINLLKGDLKKAVGSSNRGRASWLLYTAAGLVLLLFSLSFYFDFRKQGEILERRREQQSVLFRKYFGRKPAENRPVLAQAKSIVGAEEKKTEIFRKFFSQVSFSSVLTDLHRKLPPAIDFEVSSISYDTDILSVNASTGSFEQLNLIKENLRKSDLFAEVKSDREKAMPGEGGSNRVKFTLQIKPAERY